MKILYLITLLTLFLNLAHAQESYLHSRTNIRIGHTTTPDYYNLFQEYPLGNFRMEVTHGFFKTIELGGYVGYSRFGNIQYTEEADPITGYRPFTSIYSNAYSYGITANFHILPLFIKDNEPRFDIYVSSKIGGLSIFAPENSWHRGHGFDYGMYGGLSLYIARYWGAFVEYGVNKKPLGRPFALETCLRYGITIKF